MELGFASAPALNLLKMPYLAAHLGEGEFRERRSALHLHKVWEAARGGLHLPCLTDFDLSLIERLGGGCFLLEFESHRAPATFKYFGRELAIAVKRDLTGYPITAVPEGSLLAQLVMHCEEAVRTGKPIALDGLYSAGATEHLLYRSILLPFTRQGEKAECVLGCLRFRSVQARPALAHSMARTKSSLPARLDQVRETVSPSSVSYPEQFKNVLSRARQAALLNIESTPPTKRAGHVLIAMRTRIRRAIWPDSAVQFARSAPAIGKAILGEGHDREFALLLARRIDEQSGRYEIVSVADTALLNLAMRSACAKSQSRSDVRRKHRREPRGAA